MKLFQWWFNEKTVERDDAARPDAPKLRQITVGSLWTMKTGDPFAPKFPPTVIVDIKDGWVRYSMTYLPDERRTIDSFLDMYEPYNKEVTQ